MGRSGHLSGATVALELLPRDLPEETDTDPVARLTGEGEAGNLKGWMLQAGEASLALSVLEPVLNGEVPQVDAGPDAPVDRSAPPETLGRLLGLLIARKAADARLIYRIALCLATRTHSSEAHALLSLIDPGHGQAPAMLALRGYLALQNGQVEAGRRALAKAALVSRGSSSTRSILHFTQHVLLVHQFNG